MDALILEQDQHYQIEVARALMRRGFNVVCVDSVAAAESFIRIEPPRALVMGERIGGRLSHSVALLGECRNPDMAAILLTDRTGPEMSEIFDLVPAIRAILGRGVDPDTLGQMVVASLQPQGPTAVATRDWTPPVAAPRDDRRASAPATLPDAVVTAAPPLPAQASPTAPAFWPDWPADLPGTAQADTTQADTPQADTTQADMALATPSAPDDWRAMPRDDRPSAIQAQAQWREAALAPAMSPIAASMLPLAAEAAASLAAITAAPQVDLGDTAGLMTGPHPAKVWPNTILRRMQEEAEETPLPPRVLASGGTRRLTLG